MDRVSTCDDKNVLELDIGIAIHIMNVLNATDIYTLKFLISCYMNFISRK